MDLHQRRSVIWIVPLIAAVLGGCASGGSTPEATDKEAVSSEAALSEDVQRIVSLGDRAWQQGAPDTALTQYLDALEQAPDSLPILFRVAEANAREGRSAAAMPYYERMLELDPDNVAALEGSGLALIDLRQYPLANERLERAAAADPQRWRALNGLGIIADLQADYVRAAVYYSAALEVHQGSAMLANNLGYSRYMSGDLIGAEEAFLEAVGADPDFERAWQNLGLLRVRQARYTEALDIFLRSQEPHEAHNTVGYLCFLNTRYTEAEHFLRRAAELSPVYYTRAYDNLKRVEAARHATHVPTSAPATGTSDAASPSRPTAPTPVADKAAEQPAALVTVPKLKLSIDGNASSEALGYLSEGDRVEIIAQTGQWALVSASLQGQSDPVKGWTNVHGLKPLDPAPGTID